MKFKLSLIMISSLLYLMGSMAFAQPALKMEEFECSSADKKIKISLEKDNTLRLSIARNVPGAASVGGLFKLSSVINNALPEYIAYKLDKSPKDNLPITIMLRVLWSPESVSDENASIEVTEWNTADFDGNEEIPTYSLPRSTSLQGDVNCVIVRSRLR